VRARLGVDARAAGVLGGGALDRARQLGGVERPQHDLADAQLDRAAQRLERRLVGEEQDRRRAARVCGTPLSSFYPIPGFNVSLDARSLLTTRVKPQTP
jgi:hypothetical protein